MFLGVDFDGTVIRTNRDYADVTTPPELMPGVERGLRALKRAGHVLLLYSARASRALLVDPMLDPLVRAGVRRVDMATWKRSQPINIARHRQMLDFVAQRLPGVFDAIDDGAGGKPLVDRFIDDRSLRPGRGAGGMTWDAIAELFGVRLLPIPRVAQKTDFSCGAAALLATLRFFKVGIEDESDLYRALGTNAKDGTAPDQIAAVARRFGLRANWRTGVEVSDLERAIDAGVPVVLDIQDPEDGGVKASLPDGHYVVLMGIDPDQGVAWYMNPSGGNIDKVEIGDMVSRWVDVEGARGGIFVDGRA